MITKNLIARLLVIAFCIPTLALITQAQEGTEQQPVANKEIFEMVKAGLTAELIIAKIKTSPCDFDTSPSALVSLKEAGVANAVLMEMVCNPHGVQRRAEKLPAPAPTPAESVARETAQPVSDGLPEYGHISEMRRMRRVYVVADDIDSQNLLVSALSEYEGLQIVRSPDRAEVFIAFGQGAAATSLKLWGYGAGTIDYRTKAQFIVFYRTESGRPRIIFQETEDIQTSSGWTFSRPNEVNVSRHFIKELKKVRGEID
jgi:hypothetical protein